jgi:hypothetical protein
MQRWFQACGLLLVLLIGMSLRLGTAEHTQVDHPIRNDAKEYVAYAWNWKYLGIYSADFSMILGTAKKSPSPDAMRPPGYPLFLRAFVPFYLDEAFVQRVVAAQVWIAGLTLLCATLLAMELLGGWMGLVLGLLVALSPHLSVYVPYLLTETLFSAALVFAMLAAVLALKASGKPWRCALSATSGALFGVTCLIRPTLNQWAPALLMLLLLPAVRRFWREIAALTLGFALTMSPWWLRNETVLHRATDAEKMLTTVQQGSYPDLMYEGRTETFGTAYSYDSGAAKAASSWTGLLADLRAKFARQPWTMVRWYLFGKIVYFFGWASPEGWMDIFTYPVLRSPWLSDAAYRLIAAIMHGAHAPLMIFGMLGTLIAFLPRTRRLFGDCRADALRFLALLHLFVVGVHVAGLPIGRYSVPFRPLSFLLGLFLLVWLFRNYREYRRGATV